MSVFQLDVTTRNAMADALESSIGTSPTLRIFSGAIPASTSAARTGTLLATIALPSDWLTTAANGSKAKNGTWQGTANAAGVAGYADIIDSSNVVRLQGDVSFTPNATYANSTAYTAGQKILANGNIYNVTTAGTSASSGAGPSGTGASITDGTVTFAYVSAAGTFTIDNTSIQQGQVLTDQAFTYTQGNG